MLSFIMLTEKLYSLISSSRKFPNKISLDEKKCQGKERRQVMKLVSPINQNELSFCLRLIVQSSVDLIGKQALANKDLIQDGESDMSLLKFVEEDRRIWPQL